MSLIRLIHITIDPSEIEKALQVWKKECAPLMIQQKGCTSESCSAAETPDERALILSGPLRATLRLTLTVRIIRKLYVTHVV